MVEGEEFFIILGKTSKFGGRPLMNITLSLTWGNTEDGRPAIPWVAKVKSANRLYFLNYRNRL
jgi:hypothetical protein